MKILQVNNYHRIVGGSDAVYFNTGRLLAEAGHDVHWFAGSDPENHPSEDAAFFPNVMDMADTSPKDIVRYIYNSKAKRSMAALLSARGPIDLAHLHIYYGRLTASILDPLKNAGVPIVQSLHEYKLACPIYTLERDGKICEDCVGGTTMNLLRHRCKGSLARSAAVFAEYHVSRSQGDVAKIDRFICVSHFQKGIMERAGIPKGKLCVLHNFVDPAKLAPARHVQRGDYMLYFGRIETLKGVPTLVEAARRTGVRLRIAGTGAWTEQMKVRIADMPNVDYLGFVSGEPLRELVAGAAAVVVPSEWYENCPMSVLEAKAVGTPVIGARIGGIPELVDDETDGFLFKAGSADSLAKAFDRLANADLKALSAAASRDVATRFSPEAHYTKLLDIYESVGVVDLQAVS